MCSSAAAELDEDPAGWEPGNCNEVDGLWMPAGWNVAEMTQRVLPGLFNPCGP